MCFENFHRPRGRGCSLEANSRLIFLMFLLLKRCYQQKLQDERPSGLSRGLSRGLYSLRQVTEVELGRVGQTLDG